MVQILNYWVVGGDYQEEGKEFFDNLSSDPLTDLVPDAVRELKRCIKSGTDDWSTDTAEERMDLYYTYLDRLTGV